MRVFTLVGSEWVKGCRRLFHDVFAKLDFVSLNRNHDCFCTLHAEAFASKFEAKLYRGRIRTVRAVNESVRTYKDEVVGIELEIPSTIIKQLNFDFRVDIIFEKWELHAPVQISLVA